MGDSQSRGAFSGSLKQGFQYFDVHTGVPLFWETIYLSAPATVHKQVPEDAQYMNANGTLHMSVQSQDSCLTAATAEDCSCTF